MAGPLPSCPQGEGCCGIEDSPEVSALLWDRSMQGNSLLWGSGDSVRSFGASLCRACSPQELAELCECVPTACARAQTLPQPYNPFPPDLGNLLEASDLYLAWGKTAGSGLYSGWMARTP